MELWKLYDKQKQSLELIEENKFSLLIGQGRASKSTLSVYYLFKRAHQFPNTTHIIFRNTLSSAVDGIWKQTIKEVIAHFFPVYRSMPNFSINESNKDITFPNGSRILLRGLDTEERATKVLSQQFATVLFDECQTINYTYFALLLTRLPQPKDVDYQVKVVCCANWAPKTHWTKLFFKDELNPETKAKHKMDVGYITFTTDDNEAIDAEEYIDTLKNAGDKRARNMCAGIDWYEEVEGALWTLDDINRSDPLEEYEDIVIAFDASVTNKEKSDEHGITIAGKSERKYYIIKSFEKKADINQIAKEVCELYHTYGCSKLIYENNQGGDWIEALIQNHDETVYCESVRAKRSKILRAEPIAALYKNNKVLHCEVFQQLEDQMTSYTGTGDSPNALDSLVYAVKYLHDHDEYIDPYDPF